MFSILIVDNSAAYCHNIAQVLEFEGFEVRQAANPILGFAQIVQHRPDLILLDLLFPGFDGVNFIEWVRRSHSFAEIPIIVVSGHKDAEHIEEAFSSGANDYLVKPVALADLMKSIHNLKLATFAPPFSAT